MVGFLIDLDGTMYRGKQIIQSAKQWIDYLDLHEIPYLFLTNNACRTPKQAANHMNKMGYNVTADKFYTSAMAAVNYVKSIDPKATTCNYIGEKGMYEAIIEAGFTIDYHNPQYYFIGLNREATYQEYCEALRLILNGATLVGTNNDRILLNESGPTIGNGAIVDLFEYSSGKKAIKIGKPYEPIFNLSLQKLGLPKNKVYVVGDNLETDIQGANNWGFKSIFVDSGVHTLEDINELHITPTYYVESLMDINKIFNW